MSREEFDVIVAVNTPATRAILAAPGSAPVVMAMVSDPDRARFRRQPVSPNRPCYGRCQRNPRSRAEAAGAAQGGRVDHAPRGGTLPFWRPDHETEIPDFRQVSLPSIPCRLDRQLASTTPGLQSIVDKIWRYCEESAIRGRTVTLKVKYQDLEQITRSRSFGAWVESR